MWNEWHKQMRIEWQWMTNEWQLRMILPSQSNIRNRVSRHFTFERGTWCFYAMLLHLFVHQLTANFLICTILYIIYNNNHRRKKILQMCDAASGIITFAFIKTKSTDITWGWGHFVDILSRDVSHEVLFEEKNLT